MSKSKIFLFIMICFIGGVAMRSLVFIADFYIFFSFAILVLILLSFSKNKKILTWCIMFIFSFLGTWWYGVFDPSHFILDNFTEKQIIWEGRIARDPQVRGTTQRLIVVFPQAPKERVQVTVKRYPGFSYGDVVLVSGVLRKPESFDGFNYPQYLAKDGIYFLMRAHDVRLVVHSEKGFNHVIFTLKKKFENNINNALAFPHSAFVNGILLGSTAQIPQETTEAFRITGVSHITALSGYNITIIIVFVGMLLAYVISSQLAVFIISVVLIVLFVIMTGSSPSVVRSAVMGIALLLARQLGRSGRVLNILIFAAFVMILFNPKILMFDLGFQLSFLAVLGLVYVVPYFQKKFEHVPEFFNLKESLITTISAQITVLPLVLYSFSQFSIIAPLVNMLVLPLMPFAMLFGFFTGASGFLSPLLAQVFAYPLWLVVSYQLSIIDFFAQFPFAVINF